jgi:dienelactone hydrolase
MVSTSELPSLMRLENGQTVQNPQDWARRRAELSQAALALVYGPLPPVPAATRAVLLHEAVSGLFDGARLQTWRVMVDAQPAFMLRLLVPPGPEPFPVLLSGDACWTYATEAVQRSVLARGYAWAEFNRVEIMSDMPAVAGAPQTCAALAGVDTAAVAAWAWGFHRAIDALVQMPALNPQAIAVVGHSRGGKAALLAGALDERIALTCANNSGAGGAGSFHCLGQGAESLSDIVEAFPHWLSAGLQNFKGRTQALDFDQHFLKALVAPRYLLTTQAMDDLWANPEGTVATHQAASQVYEWLGAASRLVLAFRPGGHPQEAWDWQTLLAHMDTCFKARH